MTAPSMTTPAVAYFHRAMRSWRASATIVVLASGRHVYGPSRGTIG